MLNNIAFSSFKNRTCLLLLVWLLYGLVNPMKSQSLQNEIHDIADENLLVGVSVIGVCNNEVTEVIHYGKCDIARDLVVNDSTMYRIASISKAVTSIGLMKLWEQGLFHLDDSIDGYLGFVCRNPQFPNTPITFRHLLSHTSGLIDGQDYSDFLYATYAEMPPPALQELLVPGGSYYSGNCWSNHEAGQYFSYANINFGIIGTLIEKLTDIRFDEYMRDSVFVPMNIHGTFNIYTIENINNVAVLYRNGIPQVDNFQGIAPVSPNFTLYPVGSNGLLFAPQGGLRISALDLSKIMIMLLNHGMHIQNGDTIQILKETTLDEMFTPQWTYNGGNGNNYYNLFNQWCLGFQQTTNTANGDIVIPEVEMLGHAGEAYGLISDMYFTFQHKFGLVFITNGFYNGGDYQWGNYSAFYLPEEQSFAALKTYVFDSCALSVKELYAPATLNIFPNPSSDKIYIGNQILKSVEVEIIDVFGNVISRNFYSSLSCITISHLNKGMYFLRISKEDKVIYNGKILKH